MRLFVDQREIGPLSADPASTVGEVLEALAPEVGSGRVLVAVEIDGERFHAASEGPWLRRRAAVVLGLRLITSPLCDVARALRHDVGLALELISGKLDLVLADIRGGDRRAAGALLAELLEELRLVLILDRDVSSFDGAPPIAEPARLEGVGEQLLAAHRRLDVAETARLLECGLAPLVRSWRDAAAAAPSS